jgi:hypothetical protein
VSNLQGPSLEQTLRVALKSQYHAALAMLRESVERCPEELWYSDKPLNAFWQVAYHALYITHLYLQPEEAAFRPWEHEQSDVQYPDGIAGPADPESALPLIPQPYTKAEALAYCEHCDGMVDGAVDGLDLLSPTSGFDWYVMPKLEHQIANIRHLGHHAAQLADRLRSSAGVGIQWVGARASSTSTQ